jgi:deoxyribodipyrimidine photo-lyase
LDAACKAAKSGGVIPVFVWSPEEEAPFAPGAAVRAWLSVSLEALAAQLRAKGSELILRGGPADRTLLSLAEETGARAIYWNADLEPGVERRDAALATVLRSRGLGTAPGAALPPANSLFNPEEVLANGEPHASFAPFWRSCLLAPAPPRPLPAPTALVPPDRWPHVLTSMHIGLGEGEGGSDERLAGWTPGEAGATRRLGEFLNHASRYARAHDQPGADATSRLSGHLHFGEISPRAVWHVVRDEAAKRRFDATPFLRALAHREFAQHLLHRFPRAASEPMLAEFAHFRWLSDPAGLEAWKRGLTGYPLVDAGMRQLARTGFLHHRARMVCASFLVKHLLVSWQEGARWFWDRSFDADLAANAVGWQMCAGSGTFLAPSFRFLSPVTQGATFDRSGAYVRRWVPELARLPVPYVHAPWTAAPKVLASAKIALGRDYPWPIVDARAARARALAAFEAMRRAARRGA